MVVIQQRRGDWKVTVYVARRRRALLRPQLDGDPERIVLLRDEVVHALEQRAKDDRTRAVLLLRAEGYSQSEIGKRLGMTERAVEAIVYRHRRRGGLPSNRGRKSNG